MTRSHHRLANLAGARGELGFNRVELFSISTVKRPAAFLRPKALESSALRLPSPGVFCAPAACAPPPGARHSRALLLRLASAVPGTAPPRSGGPSRCCWPCLRLGCLLRHKCVRLPWSRAWSLVAHPQAALVQVAHLEGRAGAFGALLRFTSASMVATRPLAGPGVGSELPWSSRCWRRAPGRRAGAGVGRGRPGRGRPAAGVAAGACCGRLCRGVRTSEPPSAAGASIFAGDILEFLPPPPRRARLVAGERLFETLEEHSLDARGVQALLPARVAEFLERVTGAGVAEVAGNGRSGVVSRRVVKVASRVPARRRRRARDPSRRTISRPRADIPAPRTRADRGSRRDVNARGSSVGSFEHSPGLSSSCTRPCQPSRRSASFGGRNTSARSARRFSVASETSVQSDEQGGLWTTAVGVRGVSLMRSKIHALSVL